MDSFFFLICKYGVKLNQLAKMNIDVQLLDFVEGVFLSEHMNLHISRRFVCILLEYNHIDYILVFLM